MSLNRRQVLGSALAATGGLGLAKFGSASSLRNFNSVNSVNENELEEFTDKSRVAIKKGTAWLLSLIHI